MLFATFYTKNAIDHKKIIPVCGDRGTIILDGRHSIQTNIDIALNWAKKWGFEPYTSLHKGTILHSNTVYTNAPA